MPNPTSPIPPLPEVGFLTASSEIRDCHGQEIVPSQENSIALNLMTVQPVADPPEAETSADLIRQQKIENRGALLKIADPAS
jgi:hypothetical protein